ncbi:MAG: hypothetical protein HY898_15765 [Deltaproteobacteria bacterium]|nr:hypothetical protein [Deltaproteobacteria bacterium]
MRGPQCTKLVLIVVALAAPLSVLTLLDSTSHAGVQQCNTRCQTSQTNCTLRCDGDQACIEKCKQTARDCVQTCSQDGGTRG